MPFTPFTADEVTFKIEIEPEYEDPANFFDDEVAAKVRDVYQADNDWTWCVVKVIARSSLIVGTPVYLRACSYTDEDEFKGDRYYESMCNDALANLNRDAEELYRILTRS